MSKVFNIDRGHIVTVYNGYEKEYLTPVSVGYSADEVANLASFLLSEQASGITGRDWLMQTVWNQQ